MHMGCPWHCQLSECRRDWATQGWEPTKAHWHWQFPLDPPHSLTAHQLYIAGLVDRHSSHAVVTSHYTACVLLRLVCACVLCCACSVHRLRVRYCCAEVQHIHSPTEEGGNEAGLRTSHTSLPQSTPLVPSNLLSTDLCTFCAMTEFVGVDFGPGEGLKIFFSAPPLSALPIPEEG